MLDKQKTYMVLNYNTSPVAIKTRSYNELIPAGNDEVPNGIPLTIDEIIYINSTSKVFKIGMLWFEEEYEAEIYEELRIKDWRSILRNQEIYDIIMKPTVEQLERVLAIEDPMYFGRVYGAYVGLKNAGADVSKKVSDVMTMRYKELSNHKRKTEIKIRPKVAEQPAESEAVKAMQAQIEAMQKMIEQLSAAAAANPVEEAKKPAAKKTTAKKSTKKPAEAKEVVSEEPTEVETTIE